MVHNGTKKKVAFFCLDNSFREKKNILIRALEKNLRRI
jgi:hypothetical protein